MVEPTSDQNDNWVYLVESDPKALARTNRPAQIIVLIVFSFLLTVACCVWWLDPPEGQRPWLPLLIALWCAGLLICVFLCFRVQITKDGPVWFGQDFIAGSVPTVRGVAIVRYKDIVRVTLNLSKGRIMGATIQAKGMTTIVAQWLTEPAVVVRAILDHAPEYVKWRRAGQPFTSLTRDEVEALIEKIRFPDLHAALPPGCTYARADDMFPEDRSDRNSLFARRSAEQRVRAVNAVSLRAPTPISRYVNLMLLQMADTGLTKRILTQSEPLPVPTLHGDTTTSQPFEDVIRHIKTMCGMNPEQASGLQEGTAEIAVQRTRYKVTCRIDDRADRRCEIVLEEKEPAAE